MVGDDLVVFFAHPAARGLTYPMVPGQSLAALPVELPVTVQWLGQRVEVRLQFRTAGSLILVVSPDGAFRLEPGTSDLRRPFGTRLEPAIHRNREPIKVNAEGT